MRTLLLLPAMLLAFAAPQCLAQSHDDAASAASDAGAPPPRAQAAQPRSAFGRVMAVMIAKLVQDQSQRAQARATADSAATTLPIDIEVGAAFQPAATAASSAAASGSTVAPTGGASALQLPEPLVVEDALTAQQP